MTRPINIGYVALTDAAPLIAAVEMGFAQEEGLSLNLIRERNWSTVRDKLSYGIFDAAHVLLPLATALTLGLGPVHCKIDIPMILNMNGNAFVASTGLAARMDAAGSKLGDARAFGVALIELARQKPIRVAVPFLQSMHVTMLRYLVQCLGADASRVFEFQVSSPSLIETLLRNGAVDAFMVGAPWGTKAVENGDARLMLTSNSIWQGAPEKVLGIRAKWLTQNERLAVRLTRAIYRGANWVADKNNTALTSEIMSRSTYLDIDAQTIEHNLRGENIVRQNGLVTVDPLALQFDARRIGFPWKSSIGWVAAQNAPFWKFNPDQARKLAAQSCRTDIYRNALAPISGPLPLANEKIEGSLTIPTAVPGLHDLVLGPDAFFDGRIFDTA